MLQKWHFALFSHYFAVHNPAQIYYNQFPFIDFTESKYDE